MRSMDSMPGWELVSYNNNNKYNNALLIMNLVIIDLTLLYINQTQPWLTETGMPMRGLVNITYYSGEGMIHYNYC